MKKKSIEKKDSTAKSLGGFFRIIKNSVDKNSSTSNKGDQDVQTIYRGHSDANWHLLPSALREHNNIKNERLYLKEFVRQLPNETDNLDFIDILVKAQHYGIPTRMLDFTLNPLIALFFACSSNLNKDGVVLCILNQTLLPQDDIKVKVLMHYIFKFKKNLEWSKDSTNLLEKSLSKDPDVYVEINTDFIENILMSEKPIFISPKLRNVRIQVQNGLFALFNTPLDSERRKFRVLDKYDICEPQGIKKIIIPTKNKIDILRELDEIGINEAYIFPGLETGLKTIVQRIDDKTIVKDEKDNQYRYLY